ncbi:MAG: hypothetical protein NTW32_23290 [Chloroflexi bacterium]|nr:hypothetical protein [Chloroflexota bacterium]
MGKYNYFQKEKEPKNKGIHPVWRGIGCLIMVITPIISGAASMVLLDFGRSQKWPFLYQLSGSVRFPDIFYQIPMVSDVTNYISNTPNFTALFLFFVVFVLFFSSVFAFINAVLYRMFGPPRYSALDAPAPKVKIKRYTR